MKCRICLTKCTLKYLNVKNIYDANVYEIYNCEVCNIAFTKRNQKIDLKDIYADLYDYEIHEKIKNEKIWRISKNFKKIKDKINLNKKSRILDIGCMHGYFLDFLYNTYQCNCDGLEIESYYSKDTGNKNIKIFKKDITKFSIEGKNLNKYDFIILSHTLEHFENPIEVINSVITLLKKDGFCCIIVPNFESRISLLTKKYWGWLQPSVHQCHYNPDGLIKFIENRGFNLNFHSNQGGDSIFLLLTLFNFYACLINVSKKLYKKSYIKNITIRISSLLFKYMYYVGDDESMFLFKKR